MRSDFESVFKRKFPELCNKDLNPFATDGRGVYKDRAVLGSWLFYKHRQTELEELQKQIAEALSIYNKPFNCDTDYFQALDDIYHVLTNNEFT